MHSLRLVRLINAWLDLKICGHAQLVKASCTAQSGDPGSGSGRTDQDTPMKGGAQAGLTEEDIQLRRIKAWLCTAPLWRQCTESSCNSWRQWCRCTCHISCQAYWKSSVLCLSGHTGEEQAQSAEVQGAPEGKTNLLPCLLYKDNS